MVKLRKQLSMPGLLSTVSKVFSRIKDPKKGDLSRFLLSDCLKAGLAIFGLKYASLLQFERASRDDEGVKHNLRTLYQLKNVPCDTYLRERLDEVDPQVLRRAFNAIFTTLQRGKGL